MKLTKKICAPPDLNQWSNSVAYHEIMKFIQNVNQAVYSMPIRDDFKVSKAITSICTLLNMLSQKITDFPPEEQPQRFGNKSFRLWFDWLQTNALQLCQTILFDEKAFQEFSKSDISYNDVMEEISGYLIESMGNSTRIDYGTGHELAFLAFLTCLFKIDWLQSSKPSDKSITSNFVAVGLVVLPCYLRLVRQLQTVYRMEPAGSHGVWCLDDFQFVPFIWGSSQLMENSRYDPSTIANRSVAEREKDAYLLFSCIDYIYQCKTGPFEEHSNTLYSISQVPRWEKVNAGLIKMYKAEVLQKFPVVQHFLFGHLLPFDRQKPAVGPFGVSKPEGSAGLFAKPAVPTLGAKSHETNSTTPPPTSS